MNSSPRKIDPEWIVAIAAIFISLCALIVSVFQTQIMQEQRANSVWPYLMILDSNLNGFKLELENKGVGPGIIQNVNYSFDGKPVDGISDLVNFIVKEDPTTAPDSTITKKYASISTLVLGPGDSHVFLDIAYPEAEIILRARDRIGFQLCYCSIEGECWNIDGLLSRPETGCP